MDQVYFSWQGWYQNHFLLEKGPFEVSWISDCKTCYLPGSALSSVSIFLWFQASYLLHHQSAAAAAAAAAAVAAANGGSGRDSPPRNSTPNRFNLRWKFRTNFLASNETKKKNQRPKIVQKNFLKAMNKFFRTCLLNNVSMIESFYVKFLLQKMNKRIDEEKNKFDSCYKSILSELFE